MTRKHDALPCLFLGIDVNATYKNGVATIKEDEKDETADVGDPGG